MNTSMPKVLIALVGLLFVVAACSSDSGSAWTAAPMTASEGEESVAAAPAEPAEPTAEEPAAEEAAEPAPEEPAAEEAAQPAPEEPAAEETAQPAAEESAAEESAEEPAAATGDEPRVIEIQADSALRFTDSDGQPLTEIPVTSGETVLFRINNTAGFAHNFYIGTDAELMTPSATTDVGIPDWSTGVEELEWVVPEDITDLKYGCTVPGHYTLMQGVFTAAEAASEPAPEEPAAEEADAGEPAEPAAAEGSEAAEPATAAGGEPRVIELEADAALRFLQEGERVEQIPVTPGETVIFRIDNTAGFAHNFYIGADADLMVPSGSTEVGIPDWDTGVQELEWTVPEDVTDLRFACTVPGHYILMQGDFTVSP